ncbi:hypothetical protein CVD28_01670 [Bacillus sp. M6-12]|uniref:hypothetical protein n=1 Tax=Bacillus sp. M6-12 TaxID=2054166 RepID=UPI000C766BF2|nr:hypothetical protein [Bacillus sp. M6-12]PLS19142.1 hypothetical protein CVD28_01670 [Bacillus sp. M6-12]
MKKHYANGEPKFEAIGGCQYQLPYINAQGYEDSDIGFEYEDGLLWFYNRKGLKEGMDLQEMKALATILTQLIKEEENKQK